VYRLGLLNATVVFSVSISVVDPDPHHIGNMNPHPHQDGSSSNKNHDLDPQQSDKLEPDLGPHQFADDKPKCMGFEPI
jgi:hypothetical protein